MAESHMRRLLQSVDPDAAGTEPIEDPQQQMDRLKEPTNTSKITQSDAIPLGNESIARRSEEVLNRVTQPGDLLRQLTGIEPDDE